MSDWKKVKLNKVLKQYRIEHWVQDDKSYKQVSILNDGSVVLRGDKPGREIGRKRQFIVDTDKYPNTLIFTRQLLLQGSIGLAGSDVNKCIVTENMPMFSIEGIEPDYLHVFLNSEAFKEQVRALETTGSAQKSIHERQFLELEIPLPSVTEQKELVKKFKIKRESFSSITSELTTQQTLITQLRQSILQEAVQGKLVKQNKNDEPASELLKRIKAEKEKLIKQKKLKAGKSTGSSKSFKEEYYIPENWTWCKTDDILFITKLAGFEYTEHINLKESGEIPVIRAQNVRPLEIDKTNLLYIDRKTSLLLNRCSLTKKCLLVTFIGAGIGDVATFDEKERWHLAPNVAKMEPFEGCEELVNIKFINYFLMSDIGQKEIFKHVQATAQPSLSMGTIRDIDIPLPPLPEQKRIVEKVNQLMQHCNELEQQVQQSITHARQLMQAVLREVFEGKSEPLIVAD